jgi:hypothetical protein
MICEHGTENCVGRGETHHCHVPSIEDLIRERHQANDTLSKVNDAIGAAGIHCGLYFWEAIRQIAQERDEARSKFSVDDVLDLKMCVDYRIKELKEAVDLCLRRGNGAMLRHIRLTGLEAEQEISRLYRLKAKL